MPPKLTALITEDEPPPKNPVPVIDTEVPAPPVVGVNELIVGADITVMVGKALVTAVPPIVAVMVKAVPAVVPVKVAV